MERNKKIIILLGLIILAGVSVGLCQYFFSRPEPEKRSTKIENIIFIDNNPETIIDSLKQFLNRFSLGIDFKQEERPYLWWISDDGWNIIENNVFSIVSVKPISETPNPYSSPLDQIAKKLNGLLSGIFLENGFVINTTNTSESEIDRSFYDHIIAFEKEGVKCTLRINRDNWEYIVSCSDRFQEAYNEQIPYLRGLDIKDGVVTKIEKYENFARISVGHRRTGHFKIIKIDGEKMEEIFRGQESPPCKLMIENSVPKEIYITCFDESFYAQ